MEHKYGCLTTQQQSKTCYCACLDLLCRNQRKLIVTLLTLSSTEDFSSNNLTYMDVYLLLTKTPKRNYLQRERINY